MKRDTLHAGLWILGWSLLGSLLGGCAGSPPWGPWSRDPTPAQTQSAVQPGKVYVYYTEYEVYRLNHTGDYVYRENGRWLHRDQPPANLPASVLRTSPSVLLALTDTPEARHEAVKRVYPPNWDEASADVAARP